MDDEKALSVSEYNGNELEQDNSHYTELPFGQSLSIRDTYDITATEQSRFVMLMGAPGCGKTTIITSLYQLFLNKNEIINNRYFFAGSQTLSAFEERAYNTRITSNNDIPDTARTPQGADENILHLRLLKTCDKTFVNLFLCDISGEDFENANANIDLAKETFNIAKIINYFIVILDGEHLSSISEKNAEIQKGTSILQTFLNADLLHNDVLVIITISKYDLLQESDELLTDIEDDIKDAFSSRFGNVPINLLYINSAAMPTKSSLFPVGYGLNKILDNICDNVQKTKNKEINIDSKSQFDCYGKRCEG